MQEILFFFHEHFMLSIIWFFSLIIAMCLIIKNMFLRSIIINNTQAIKLLNQDKAVIIDTRSSELFREGHIINSVNFPLKNILSNQLKEIEIYKSFPVILIFQETYGQHKYVKELLKNGFKLVYVLKDGIHCWNLDNLPLVNQDK